jgi:hypothetical protein
MKAPLVFCTAILITAWSTPRAGAAVSSAFTFAVARAPHRLALDPALSDPAWNAGRVPDNGGWQNVTTRGPAPEKTTAYLLYDDRFLYVAFVAEQRGDPIVGTQTTDDVGFGSDDFVAVGADPSGNGSQAYFFETTPRGIRYEQASENVRFRPVWQSAARVSNGSWSAVMQIPLGVLRVRPGARVWRIGFFRNLAGRGEHLSWAYDPTMQDDSAGSWPSFSDVRFWPAATGIMLTGSLIKPKPRVELFGLGSIGLDRNLYEQANGTFTPERTRTYGLDFSLPVTPTINLVGTANPDFSNVEVDQQTIAPQEFARQLVEYRPFFAQGASYLGVGPISINFNSAPNELFYSPSIGPFDSGLKAEGTFGLQSFEMLWFRGFDETSGNTFDDQAFGFRHALSNGTFSYWFDGVLAHHSIAGTDSTSEAGVSTHNLKSGFEFQFDGASESGSWVPGGSAHSIATRVAVDKPNYQAVFGYANLSPAYDPIDGFTAIADLRGFAGYVNLNGSTPALKNWALFVQGDRFTDATGAVHEADANVFLSATFKNGLSLNGLGPSTSELRGYDGNFFTGYPSYANPSTVPFNLFNVPLGYRDGTPTPIDASAAWGNFGGNRQHFYSVTTSRPLGGRYTLGLEYDASYQRSLTTGMLDSQFLRRISIGVNVSSSLNLTLGLRDISGLGGFSPEQGLNAAAGLHLRLPNGDLYANYGSPSAYRTLNRFIVKYVLRAGGDAGT